MPRGIAMVSATRPRASVVVEPRNLGVDAKYTSTLDPLTKPPYESLTLSPGCTTPGEPSAPDGVDSISSEFGCSATGGELTGDGAVVVGGGVEGAAVVVVVDGAVVVGEGVEGAAVVDVVVVVDGAGTAAGFTTTISGSSVIEMVTEPSTLASPSRVTTPPTMA